MKRVGVFPVTQTMLFTTKKILCGFICTFFSALPLSSSAPSFTLCIGGLQLRLAQTSSHMCTHQSCYMQQPQSTVVNTAAHQVTLCCSDLCLRCVCDRWRERGLPFWSGSRQTHENGPYSKFRTGITTFFLYTVLDKCETSTFSRLHTCSSNFVMLCPRHGWYYLFSVIRWSVLGQILNALFPLMLPLLCDSVSER